MPTLLACLTVTTVGSWAVDTTCHFVKTFHRTARRRDTSTQQPAESVSNNPKFQTERIPGRTGQSDATSQQTRHLNKIAAPFFITIHPKTKIEMKILDEKREDTLREISGSREVAGRSRTSSHRATSQSIIQWEWDPPPHAGHRRRLAVRDWPRRGGDCSVARVRHGNFISLKV
jgi:hypothetical protein